MQPPACARPSRDARAAAQGGSTRTWKGLESPHCAEHTRCPAANWEPAADASFPWKDRAASQPTTKRTASPRTMLCRPKSTTIGFCLRWPRSAFQPPLGKGY